MIDEPRRYGKLLYQTVTPSTKRGSLYAAPLSLLLFVYGTMLLGGIAVGAQASVAGDSVSSVLSIVGTTRFELWMDFARSGTLSRVVFGLIYPIIAGMFTILSLGIKLGHAVPQLGYVVEGLNLLWPVAALGFIVLQFTRYIELRRE